MASDVQSFEFKPALMRGRNNWTLDAGFLTRNGELFCSLDNITGVRFAQMRVRYTHSAWLDLAFAGGRHRITCNMPPGDESHSQFLTLVTSILDELSDRKPDMQVAMGAGSGVRWAMFLIGVFAALFGLAFLLITASGGVRESKALFAYVFGSGFTAFGVGLAWVYRPWAPPALLPVALARELIARLSLDHDPTETEADRHNPEDDKR